MGPYKKVIWNEGMKLTPHHFQQWDNYHEERLNSRVEAFTPYSWGVSKLQLSDAAIAKGSCEVSQCEMLMPDGLPVSIPRADAAPPSRPISDLIASGDRKLSVYAAVPAVRAGAPKFQTNGGERDTFVRYWQESARVTDETTGSNEQQLSFARSNFRLIFDGEPLEGYSSIKIAEIIRTQTGTLVYEKNYIPPALDLGASPWLSQSLKELVDILTAKSSSLSEQRSQRTPTLVEFRTSEVAVFWLLHTVNSFIPGLTHLLRTHPVHPERLYTELATLCGQLMTFVPNRHPQDIAAYEHTDLYGTFSQLFQLLRLLLETVIPTRCVPIPLTEEPNGAHLGRVPDELLKDAEFYLAVNANVPIQQLIEYVQTLVKVGSLDIIDYLIDGALHGLRLEHAHPPPSPIPSVVGFHYFNLEKRGRYWERIKNAKNIAIFVPSIIPEPRLELYAVKP